LVRRSRVKDSSMFAFFSLPVHSSILLKNYFLFLNFQRCMTIIRFFPKASLRSCMWPNPISPTICDNASA